jgi:hypothetical protein
MTEKVPTYERFALHTIMSAVGWSAVYFDDGTHMIAPIHALALTSRRQRNAHTTRLVKQPDPAHEEEEREIVGMEYHPTDGWNICDESENCCGLLPPGMTLGEFEEKRECH